MFFQPVFIQDNALGMPIDQSALLMVAFCSSQAQILDPSRYHFTPAGTVPPPIYRYSQISVQKDPVCSADYKLWGYPTEVLITGWVKIPDLGRARKTMLLFWINVLEPKLAFVLPYLTNHQEMTTVHSGLPNTRHSYIYMYMISILYIYSPLTDM